MNGNSLTLSAPRFFVGDWDRLTAQQQRVFITFVVANFGDAGGDPAGFARGLWNESAEAANTDRPPGSDRLLNLSRLTTFIGVTSLWEKRGVIDLVTVVTNINGDQQSQNFRLYGQLAAGGGQRIKDTFKYSIVGSGHGEYSVSRRERNFWKEPNGQFSLTKDLRRFDSDVDYRSLWDTGHNTKENSDIRAFDGGTPHLTRHLGRYGPVPITMQDAFLGPTNEAVLFSEVAGAPDAAAQLEVIARAKSVSDAFVERFRVRRTLDGLFEEMFAPGAIAHIKATGFFTGVGLAEGLVDSLPEEGLVLIYKRVMDYFYLHNLFELETEFLGAVALGERSQEPPEEMEKEFRSMPQFRSPDDGGEAEDPGVDTHADLEQYLATLGRTADWFRERLGAGRQDILRANIRSINIQRENPYRVEATTSESGDADPRNIYTVEQGVFIVQTVEDGGDLKIINLGVGD